METNKIYQMDCLEFMRSLPDGCVDLIVTSPPYNKNAHASANVKPWKGESWSNMRGRQIAYDVYSDDMPQEQYEAWQKDVISECLRILKDTGSLFYNHKDIISEGRIIPSRWVYDFPLHQQLIWERPGTPALDPHYFFPNSKAFSKILLYLPWMMISAEVIKTRE